MADLRVEGTAPSEISTAAELQQAGKQGLGSVKLEHPPMALRFAGHEVQLAPDNDEDCWDDDKDRALKHEETAALPPAGADVHQTLDQDPARNLILGIFELDRENKRKAIVFCHVCKTKIRRKNMNVHSETQTHQRLLAEDRADPASAAARETKHFCELCQVKLPHKKVPQHEGSKNHLEKLREQAVSLGLQSNSAPITVPEHRKRFPWTDEDDEKILRAYLDMKDDEEIMLLFPDKTKGAVKDRRTALTTYRKYGDGELRVLRPEIFGRLWDESSNRQMVKQDPVANQVVVVKQEPLFTQGLVVTQEPVVKLEPVD